MGSTALTADLGEITRNILLHFIDMSLLFQGYSSKILNTHYGFDASFVSAVEGTDDHTELKSILVKQLGISAKYVDEQSIDIVKWACNIVAGRAAALSACAIAAVVLHTKNDKAPEGEKDTGVDVGMDGSVVEFLPNFEPRVRKALATLLGEAGEKRIRMGMAKDGSGVGGRSFFRICHSPTFTLYTDHQLLLRLCKPRKRWTRGVPRVRVHRVNPRQLVKPDKESIHHSYLGRLPRVCSMTAYQYRIGMI